MSSIFDILAEQRIVDAIKRGELASLPGAGKPLEFDDDLLVPPEQRMANRILRNAGFTPLEVTLRREISALRREIEALPRGELRSELGRKLAWLLIQLQERS